MNTFILKISFLGVLYLGGLTASAQENGDVTSLIKKKREYNKLDEYGYKIQLYNGEEKKARSIKYRFEKNFYWIKTKLEFESPYWKVQVGNFNSRLEADKELNKIREKFSGAIIINKY